MKCTRCGQENGVGASYCYACGEPFGVESVTAEVTPTLPAAPPPTTGVHQGKDAKPRASSTVDVPGEVSCPSCGAVVSAERKFCTSCGVSLRRTGRESPQADKLSGPPRVEPAKPPAVQADPKRRVLAASGMLAAVSERITRAASGNKSLTEVREPVEVGAPVKASCPRCGQQVRQGKSFCFECGAALTSTATAPATPVAEQADRRQDKPSSAPAARRFCTSCGTEISPSKPFCSNCGTKAGDQPAAPVPTAHKSGGESAPTRTGVPPRPLTEEEQWEVWTREELVKHGKPPLMGYPAKKGQESVVKLARAAVALASAKLDEESPQAAIAEIDRFLADSRLRPFGLKEFNALAFYIRGLANERSGNWKAASKDYESASREDKKYERPHEALARLKAAGH